MKIKQYCNEQLIALLTRLERNELELLDMWNNTITPESVLFSNTHGKLCKLNLPGKITVVLPEKSRDLIEYIEENTTGPGFYVEFELQELASQKPQHIYAVEVDQLLANPQICFGELFVVPQDQFQYRQIIDNYYQEVLIHRLTD